MDNSPKRKQGVDRAAHIAVRRALSKVASGELLVASGDCQRLATGN
jgi:hypothetical protein